MIGDGSISRSAASPSSTLDCQPAASSSPRWNPLSALNAADSVIPSRSQSAATASSMLSSSASENWSSADEVRAGEDLDAHGHQGPVARAAVASGTVRRTGRAAVVGHRRSRSHSRCLHRRRPAPWGCAPAGTSRLAEPEPWSVRTTASGIGTGVGAGDGGAGVAVQLAMIATTASATLMVIAVRILRL